MACSSPPQAHPEWPLPRAVLLGSRDPHLQTFPKNLSLSQGALELPSPQCLQIHSTGPLLCLPSPNHAHSQAPAQTPVQEASLDAGPPTSDLPTRRASTASLPKSPLAPQPKSFGGSHYRMVLVRPDDLAHLSHLTPGLISLKPSPQLQAGHAPQRWSRLPSAPIPSSCCSLARRAIDRPRPVLVTRGQQRNASER